MVMSLHPWFAVLPALSLLAVPACGGGGDDDSTGTPATSATSTGSTTGADPTTGTDPTTSTNPTTGADPTTVGTDPTTTTAPTTTGDTTTTNPGTTGATTGETGDTGDTSTGGAGPEDIPEIPDDGKPSSANLKPVPLGMSAAKQGYWEFTPDGYGGGELYPLLVFLHGLGENGDGDSELNKLLNSGPPGLIEGDQWPADRPFVVLSPQHSGGGCPGPDEVHDFITYAVSAYDINPARIYLTGLSCGAGGAFGYLAKYLDEQIVAMVPIAGDGKGAFKQAGCMLGKVALWAFHGDADNIVDVSGTKEPITELQMCDPKPEAEMVIYPGVGHDSWTMTYDLAAGHDIYAWLLKHFKQ